MIVLFDVDGVLVDSLGAHLDFCERLNRLLGLRLRIPSQEEFRSLARSTTVSPMTALFAALGFPADRLDEAIRYYRDNFARDYPVHMFPGTPEMLQQLHAAGAVMGVVTANLRVNVKVALGPNWDLFRPDLRFTADDEFQRTKAGALLYAAEILQVEPQEITYLGDQLGDYEAARQAGTRFLGATWGWAIARGDARFETVDTPSEIEAYFAKRRNVQEEKGRS